MGVLIKKKEPSPGLRNVDDDLVFNLSTKAKNFSREIHFDFHTHSKVGRVCKCVKASA